MASSDVDQKYLGRIARATAPIDALVSQSLFQILGISTLLARRVYRARRLRKLDPTRDTRSLQLYHHIIWLSREGLSLLEVCVLPHAYDSRLGPEFQVLSAKLRGSFYHIFCLFANNPPITQASIPAAPAATSPTPLSPRQGNGQRRTRSGSGASQTERTPKRNSRGRDPTLRDPIASITSEASFLTNPYAGVPPGTTPSPGMGLPPGLTRIEVPHPSAFLIPPMNFVPTARSHFQNASAIAAAVLPGAHPLRLSVAIEHAAFLWDCVHDHEGSRQLARRAIRELRDGEDQGITDEMFEDAAEMVGVLARIMRRKSWESTPRSGGRASTEPTAPTAATTEPPPPMPAFAPPAPVEEMQRDALRRAQVQRDQDEQNIPAALQGGPVGGSPTSRRTSRSSRHAHTRSNGSRSTRETAIRTSTQTHDTSPRAPPRTARPQETPPRPPPKDRPSTRTTPASRRPSTSSQAPSTGRVSKGKSPATPTSQGTTRRRSTRSRDAYAYAYGYAQDENVPPSSSAERPRTRDEYHYQDYPAYPAYPPPAVQGPGVNGADVAMAGGYGNGYHYGSDWGGGDAERER